MESWIFELMSRSSNPEVAQLLTTLGRNHPDRQIAKEARKAARRAARNASAQRAAGRAGRTRAEAARR